MILSAFVKHHRPIWLPKHHGCDAPGGPCNLHLPCPWSQEHFCYRKNLKPRPSRIGRTPPASSSTVFLAKSGLQSNKRKDAARLYFTCLTASFEQRVHGEIPQNVCHIVKAAKVSQNFETQPGHVCLSKILYASDLGTISGMQYSARWPSPQLEPHSFSTRFDSDIICRKGPQSL